MSEPDFEQLVAGLRDFRARSESISDLVAAGEAAIQPLIHALHSERQEGAQWAILRCLGALRARDAVIDIVGADKTILCSDLGQVGTLTPLEGIRRGVATCIAVVAAVAASVSKRSHRYGQAWPSSRR